VGARDAHVFPALTPYSRKDKVDPADQKMLDMCVGERVNIFTEEACVEGPEAAQREGAYTPAPRIQIGSFNSGSRDDEDELLSWYGDFRLPSTKVMSSSIGTRKLVRYPDGPSMACCTSSLRSRRARRTSVRTKRRAPAAFKDADAGSSPA
jgi:hypothetical protein